MHASRTFAGYDAYRPGNAWFKCDRCSQRWRRSKMRVEWDNLRVCPPCLDPRPPQMQPPDVFPEGIPFFDARPPGDLPDRTQDETSLRSVLGGMAATPGDASGLYDGQLLDSHTLVILDSNNQPILVTPLPIASKIGLLSPLQIEQSPPTMGPNVLADDITFITGPVAAPSATQ